MKEVVLQGQNITSLDAFHDQFSLAFDFGPYYGRNLSAMWDLLTTEVERPIHLRWMHAAASQAALGPAFDEIIQVLEAVALQDLDRPPQERFTLHVDV